MVMKFEDHSNRFTRSLQLWLILIGKARNRQTITYGELADMIGYGGATPIGDRLDPIYRYCEVNKLPPLTVIVVNKSTGEPGSGMGEFSYAQQEAVFQYDCYSIFPPTVEELEALF